MDNIQKHPQGNYGIKDNYLEGTMFPVDYTRVMVNILQLREELKERSVPSFKYDLYEDNFALPFILEHLSQVFGESFSYEKVGKTVVLEFDLGVGPKEPKALVKEESRFSSALDILLAQEERNGR